MRDLMDRCGISVTLTPAATERLIEEGYDPVYGARPLKRVIQRQIIDPLALKLIQGNIHDGDHVSVDVQNGELNFAVVETAVTSPG